MGSREFRLARWEGMSGSIDPQHPHPTQGHTTPQPTQPIRHTPSKPQADLALADVNQNTALHLALMERNLDVAQALIRAGAPLDVPNRSNKARAFFFGGRGCLLCRVVGDVMMEGAYTHCFNTPHPDLHTTQPKHKHHPHNICLRYSAPQFTHNPTPTQKIYINVYARPNTKCTENIYINRCRWTCARRR